MPKPNHTYLRRREDRLRFEEQLRLVRRMTEKINSLGEKAAEQYAAFQRQIEERRQRGEEPGTELTGTRH